MNKVSFVRLTSNEFSQLKSLDNHQIFQHINIQHYGIPKDILEAKTFKAIEILKHGIIGETEPILNFNNLIRLELLDIKLDIKVIDINKFINLKIPILMNVEGNIVESLYSKYVQVLREDKSQINQMHCYIRFFRILK